MPNFVKISRFYIRRQTSAVVFFSGLRRLYSGSLRLTVYLLAVVYMLSAFALIIFSLICINGVDDTTPPIGEQSIVMTVSVCLCVCLSTIISSELHVRPSPNFSCMLPMAVAWFFSGGGVIRYVLPVLWMTSCLLISQGCSMLPHTQPWAWL